VIRQSIAYLSTASFRKIGSIERSFHFTEFLKYKIEKPPTVGTPSSTSSILSSLGETTGGDLASGVSGLLSVHLLAGRGLRSTTTSSAATTPSTPSGQPNLGALAEIIYVLVCRLRLANVNKIIIIRFYTCPILISVMLQLSISNIKILCYALWNNFVL